MKRLALLLLVVTLVAAFFALDLGRWLTLEAQMKHRVLLARPINIEKRHPGEGRGPIDTLAERDTGLRRYDVDYDWRLSRAR